MFLVFPYSTFSFYLFFYPRKTREGRGEKTRKKGEKMQEREKMRGTIITLKGIKGDKRERF
jgi:hypothetical protein